VWYHLYGAGQGTLQVQQKPEVGRAKTLWTKSNNQGLSNLFALKAIANAHRIRLDNIWRQMKITVPPLLGMSTYQIQIVGIVGSKPTGGKRKS
jgi:hypothetical protein